MVKDMDSYIDRCIGKEDFFKLATVNDLNSQKNCFIQSFCKNEKYFHFHQDVQLLDFTARKMKMPVGEKKKRKDKEGEKVCRKKIEVQEMFGRRKLYLCIGQTKS